MSNPTASSTNRSSTTTSSRPSNPSSTGKLTPMRASLHMSRFSPYNDYDESSLQNMDFFQASVSQHATNTNDSLEAFHLWSGKSLSESTLKKFTDTMELPGSGNTSDHFPSNFSLNLTAGANYRSAGSPTSATSNSNTNNTPTNFYAALKDQQQNASSTRESPSSTASNDPGSGSGAPNASSQQQPQRSSNLSSLLNENQNNKADTNDNAAVAHVGQTGANRNTVSISSMAAAVQQQNQQLFQQQHQQQLLVQHQQHMQQQHQLHAAATANSASQHMMQPHPMQQYGGHKDHYFMSSNSGSQPRNATSQQQQQQHMYNMYGAHQMQQAASKFPSHLQQHQHMSQMHQQHIGGGGYEHMMQQHAPQPQMQQQKPHVQQDSPQHAGDDQNSPKEAISTKKKASSSKNKSSSKPKTKSKKGSESSSTTSITSTTSATAPRQSPVALDPHTSSQISQTVADSIRLLEGLNGNLTSLIQRKEQVVFSLGEHTAIYDRLLPSIVDKLMAFYDHKAATEPSTKPPPNQLIGDLRHRKINKIVAHSSVYQNRDNHEYLVTRNRPINLCVHYPKDMKINKRSIDWHVYEPMTGRVSPEEITINDQFCRLEYPITVKKKKTTVKMKIKLQDQNGHHYEADFSGDVVSYCDATFRQKVNSFQSGEYERKCEDTDVK